MEVKMDKNLVLKKSKLLIASLLIILSIGSLGFASTKESVKNIKALQNQISQLKYQTNKLKKINASLNKKNIELNTHITNLSKIIVAANASHGQTFNAGTFAVKLYKINKFYINNVDVTQSIFSDGEYAMNPDGTRTKDYNNPNNLYVPLDKLSMIFNKKMTWDGVRGYLYLDDEN